MNFNSNKQLADLLYVKLQLPCKYETDTGAPSTDKKSLEYLEDKHPLIPKLMEYKRLQKTLTTYALAWQIPIHYVNGKKKGKLHPKTGRVHFYLNQIATCTGRAGSDGQQFPKVTTEAPKIRRAPIAGPGNVLLEADYSQIELRGLAHYSQDTKLLTVLRKHPNEPGGDIHQDTANRLAEYSVDRDKAKTINFGLNYGKTPWSLAEDFKISLKEAEGIMNAYFREYPGIKRWQNAHIKETIDKGYVETLLGRRRMISSDIAAPKKMLLRKGQWVDLNVWRRDAAKRQALNTRIQGTAADIIKLAMIAVAEALESYPQVKILLQVHDDLKFELPEKLLPKVVPIIKRAMENVVKLDVPIPVNMKYGKNLAEMKEYK